MSKSKRRQRTKKAAEQAAESQTPESGLSGRRIPIIIIAVFVVLILLIVWINHYFSEDQKYYRIDVITVDGVSSVGMGEFIRRCHASGSDPMGMLSTLTREIVLQKEAELLELEVSDEAVDQKLRELAQGVSGNITESEFREWYRQRINETGLSDKEYRKIIATGILSEVFQELITSITPTSAEQVYLHAILLDTEEDALKAIARIEAGENFADLASELSVDATSRDNGGVVGWVPRKTVHEGMYDEDIFVLPIGEISEPIPLYDTSVSDPASPAMVNFYIFLVTEKDEDREVDEKYLDKLYNNAYNDWMNRKMTEYDIRFKGIGGSFDSTTYSWINWQLQKLTGE